MSQTILKPQNTIPPLENGDQLTQIEFEQRYEKMPDVKKKSPDREQSLTTKNHSLLLFYYLANSFLTAKSFGKRNCSANNTLETYT
ncbi:hypothetical protein [Okeania sp. SIO2C2]|uniref:hypothetical protein n=1 Tax=Okeania sp. SIO2C2 TaxID=2607787 RepID=UPI00257FAE57|nr:hypothetical protein [Okeania sp. SIO2C2]